MSIHFQKGDRVVCVEPPRGEKWLSGNHGTVCRNPVKGSLMAAVCWDSLIYDMSNGIWVIIVEDPAQLDMDG